MMSFDDDGENDLTERSASDLYKNSGNLVSNLKQ